MKEVPCSPVWMFYTVITAYSLSKKKKKIYISVVQLYVNTVLAQKEEKNEDSL